MTSHQTPQHISGFIPEHQADLSLEEISRTCAVQVDFIIELVEEGVIEPIAGADITGWRFAGTQMHRAKVAWRLQRDLGVNLAGAALALQLLEEIESLNAQIG